MSNRGQHGIRVTNLPSHPTPFIGRIGEMADVAGLLAKPACHLLTLLGPGGVGKTRLATQVASHLVDTYAHGICFVPLQSFQLPEFLTAALVDALRLPVAGPEALTTQLMNYLKGKELLLLLDNFEQLVAKDGPSILAGILAAAPGVKILVTSREALDLQEEWIYTLKGLPFSGGLPDDNLADLESVQLFVERAQRVRQDFLLADELSGVVRICQLVEGVPLALELAATWTKMLPCAAIADEMARNLDLLATSRRGVPERHQSMRMVFDQTWRQLNQKERDVFLCLSIFRDGFQHQAAEQVADASLPILSRLQDKSLLRWDKTGRYHIHELLRQYAADKLAQSTNDLSRIRDSHCVYYADYLNEREGDLMGSRQLEATAEVEAELENIRAAWQWAVQHAKIPEIHKAAFALGNFFQFQSRYQEALNFFEPASATLLEQPETKERNLALIDTLMVRSWFNLRFGRVDELEEMMVQSQAIHRLLDTDPGPGYVTDPDNLLAFAELIKGNYEGADRYARRALQTSERCDHRGNRKFAYFLLSQASLAQGQVDEAQNYAQEAYAIAQANNDSWFMAYVLNTLATVSLIREAYPAAVKQFEASYAIRKEFNDAEGMAVALNHLSDIAMRQKDYSQARQYFEQSLHLYQDINDRGGLAATYHGLGYLAQVQDDYATARQFYHQALQLAAEIQFVPAILNLFVGIGELLCRLRRTEKGLTLFAQVQYNQATNQATKDRATQLLDRYKLQTTAKQFAAATQQGQDGDLQEMVKALLVELPSLDPTPVPDKSDGFPADDPNQALVEPLTARELEVLQLLAASLSNREIADQLVIAEGTVKYYTRQIYGKLQVRNRLQAVAIAQELGLV